jgi:hypothetical protein
VAVEAGAQRVVAVAAVAQARVEEPVGAVWRAAPEEQASAFACSSWAEPSWGSRLAKARAQWAAPEEPLSRSRSAPHAIASRSASLG